MADKHPYIEVINAWYNGEECEIFNVKDCAWRSIGAYSHPNNQHYPFLTSFKIRVRSKAKRYRVAGMQPTVTNHLDPRCIAEELWPRVEGWDNFVCWLTEPFECDTWKPNE